ncbi:MAG TPA: PrgI family protein [Chloroflexota bacterium]|nr:PrgI family protein [Chloroflexota bacterium]
MTTRHHEVPTHLNVEDRVIFGLTARQFLYVLVGSSASYALWDQPLWLGDALRLASVVLTLGTTLAFALVRPADRALEEWLVAALVYAASPRRATWQPAEPSAADWRPKGARWQELAPSLAWAADDGE